MKAALLPFGWLLLGACTGKPPAPQAQPAVPASTRPPWAALRADEQRARAVRQTLEHQQAAERQRIDEDTP
ncbi:hypothetical protein [Aerosticca soli]|uniref:Lipoprotein n=1 Tax=Aerosticca soli TaxID=2010829 RepID=A0A2Z6E7X0_9GAMM|nr:hypothetical protein [Aerosticca soli]BBD81235.1 hypothetical protein ALSL_2611 [Aerosticca soli]